MQRTNQILYCSKLCALFLGLLLSFNTLAFSGNAYAQVAHAARSSSRNSSSSQEVKAAAFYDNMVKYIRGKIILVSLSRERMFVYENGHELFDTPVTTGRPQLPTPRGVYHIFRKRSPATFYSAWPEKFTLLVSPNPRELRARMEGRRILHPRRLVAHSLWSRHKRLAL